MSEALRLGILATHPVQYHAPLYRALSTDPRVRLTVYFAHRPTPIEQGVGFGVPFAWDVDLTSGFDHVFLKNVSRSPSVSHFGGCDTPSIADIVRREGFDAFLVMGWHSRSYLQAAFAGWRNRTPMLVRGDSQLDPSEPMVKRLAKRTLYPVFIKRFAACLSVGQRSEQYFRRYGATTVIRAPHYVDNAFFAAGATVEARAASRAEWGLPDDALVCLFAGKFVEKKRPADIVEALALQSDPRLWALFVGDGELRPAIQARARERRVQTHFVGFMNQTAIRRAYAAADLLILPSDAGETWGLVVNEAMASGRPAIVSNAVGCAPDLIIPGVTGFSYQLGDVRTLGALVSRAASERAICEEMGTMARRKIAEYSVTAAAEGVVTAARGAAGARQ